MYSFRDSAKEGCGWFKGQVASISSRKSATNFFSDYILKVEQQQNTPFPVDWHQYAHILHNISRVDRKTSHSEASHHKNEPFGGFYW